MIELEFISKSIQTGLCGFALIKMTKNQDIFWDLKIQVCELPCPEGR